MGGSKSAKGGPNPLADMHRGGPNPLWTGGSKSGYDTGSKEIFDHEDLNPKEALRLKFS